VLSIDSLKARPIDHDALKAQAAKGHDALFCREWMQLQRPSPDGSTLQLAGIGWSELTAPGTEAQLYADLQALQDALAQGTTPPELVLVRAAALAGEDAKPGELAEDAHVLATRTLDLLKAWLADERLSEGKLVLLTEGALAVGDAEEPNLAQAALPGLLRTAQAEHPGRFSLIDSDSSEASQDALYGALSSEEPELALREGAPYAARLARVGSTSSLIAPSAEQAWHLVTRSPGTLENLALCENARAEVALGPGQVRIAVHATGLNFRDVLVALGVVSLPGEVELGGEGAGVVMEVAPDVSHLAAGDRVMGLMPEAFGPIAISEQQLLVKIPDDWSYAQAASVPIVFLTAFYGLIDLARLRPGEAVLVHGAAGGVGMAAVQLAAHLGAEVFATAHPDKWGALRELGIDEAHISSSRSLGFKEKFSTMTDARGMDVVLDSLAGEFVDASLDLLPRGGRFLEMGKTDIRDPEEVGGAHPGVHYRAFDIQEAGPRIGEMLREIVTLFERGVLRHLPITQWDVRRAPEAFRFLRESRHIGKIVLSMPQPPDPDGTVMITGGTGGLGALVARHLASAHGVRQLLLVSRRGPEAEGAESLRAELAELGCQARIAACDVSQRAQLKELVDSIEERHPLTAVIHAAGLLDDGVIEALDGERLTRVMAPKLDAALHLHELTEQMPLAEFILFSSTSATLGAPGQGNYAAANAFLDALAHYRRARGLPATSLAWGGWEKLTGMTAALSEADRGRWERLGVMALSNEQGLELLDTARGVDRPLLIPVRLDTAVLRAQARAGMLPAVLSGLVRMPARRAGEAQGSLARRLASVAQSEWDAILSELVKGHVAAVLGHASGEAVDPDRAFKEAGFDSLGAVELRNRLSLATGLRLPPTLVFDHPTPAAVAQYLRSRVTSHPARTSIDHQLDELESALASVARNDGERARLSGRLRLLNKWLGRIVDGRGAANLIEESADDLVDVESDEELFAIVEKELDP
jgi:polyketide synthase 12